MFTKYKIQLLIALTLVILLCLALGCGPSKHTFQKYDFSFDYRADIEATFERGSAIMGGFTWVTETNGVGVFDLIWYKVSEQPEGVKDIMEKSVQGSSQATKAWAEIFVLELEGRQYGVMVTSDWAITGQPTAEVMGGYKVSYQFVRSQPGSGVQGVGICAIWYCKDIDKLFILDIVGYDPLKEVMGFLKTFRTRPG